MVLKSFTLQELLYGYIDKLEKIDINPICISIDVGNDKGVVCIESMFKRCMEIAEKDYFK